MSTETQQDLQLEGRLQRQRANRRCEMRELLREEMLIDRAKSQSKCRSDKYMLHKDTYHIINVQQRQKLIINVECLNKKVCRFECRESERERERERGREPRHSRILSLNKMHEYMNTYIHAYMHAYIALAALYLPYIWGDPEARHNNLFLTIERIHRVSWAGFSNLLVIFMLLFMQHSSNNFLSQTVLSLLKCSAFAQLSI